MIESRLGHRAPWSSSAPVAGIPDLGGEYASRADLVLAAAGHQDGAVRQRRRGRIAPCRTASSPSGSSRACGEQVDSFGRVVGAGIAATDGQDLAGSVDRERAGIAQAEFAGRPGRQLTGADGARGSCCPAARPCRLGRFSGRSRARDRCRSSTRRPSARATCPRPCSRPRGSGSHRRSPCLVPLSASTSPLGA